MSHRPYPNRDRVLGNLRRQQAVYLYAHVPRRYVPGADPSRPGGGAAVVRLAWPAGPGLAAFTPDAHAAIRRALAPLIPTRRQLEIVAAACQTERSS